MKVNKPGFSFEKFELKLSKESQTRFKGSLRIEGLKSGRPNHRITLNQHRLHITNAEITHLGKNGETIHELTRINHLRKRGEVRLHTKTMLYPGNYVLDIEYWGHLTESIKDGVFTKNNLHISDLAELNLDEVLIKSLMPTIVNED